MGKCPNCSGTESELISGENVCRTCGLVIDDNTLTNDAFFTSSTYIDSMETRHMSNSLRSRTRFILTHIENIASNFSLSVESQNNMKQLAEKYCTSEGWRGGKVAEKQAAALVYFVCRMTEKPLLLYDLAACINCDVFDIGQFYFRISQFFNTQLPIQDPALLIERFVHEINPPKNLSEVKALSIKVVMVARDNWIITGRKPEIITAAAISIAMQCQGLEDSVEKLAEIIHRNPNRIRKRIAEILKSLHNAAQNLPWGSLISLKNIHSYVPKIIQFTDFLQKCQQREPGAVYSPPVVLPSPPATPTQNTLSRKRKLTSITSTSVPSTPSSPSDSAPPSPNVFSSTLLTSFPTSTSTPSESPIQTPTSSSSLPFRSFPNLYPRNLPSTPTSTTLSPNLPQTPTTLNNTPVTIPTLTTTTSTTTSTTPTTPATPTTTSATTVVPIIRRSRITLPPTTRPVSLSSSTLPTPPTTGPSLNRIIPTLTHKPAASTDTLPTTNASTTPTTPTTSAATTVVPIIRRSRITLPSTTRPTSLSSSTLSTPPNPPITPTPTPTPTSSPHIISPPSTSTPSISIPRRTIQSSHTQIPLNNTEDPDLNNIPTKFNPTGPPEPPLPPRSKKQKSIITGDLDGPPAFYINEARRTRRRKKVHAALKRIYLAINSDSAALLLTNKRNTQIEQQITKMNDPIPPKELDQEDLMIEKLLLDGCDPAHLLEGYLFMPPSRTHFEHVEDIELSEKDIPDRDMDKFVRSESEIAMLDSLTGLSGDDDETLISST